MTNKGNRLLKFSAILAKASLVSSSFPPRKWDGNEFKH